jgi:hypothetical protein
VDQILYKYRTDSPYTEQLITSGEIFLATAQELNDPFECSLQDISKDWLHEKVETDMQAALSGFVMSAKHAEREGGNFFGLDSSAADEALQTILSGGNLEASYEAMREFIRQRTGYPSSDCRVLFRRIDQQLVQTGIFSMSANPAQPLMWAHYADSHKGLCIGFREVGGSKLADPNHCLPVTYSDKLPKISEDGLKTTISFAADEEGRLYTSGVKISFDDGTFQRVVTTKPTCWSYEEEFRYIEPFGGLSAWPGELAECTFGWRCPDVRRQAYISLLKENVPNDVLLFEMRPEPGSNALIRVPMNPPVVRGRKRAKRKPKTKNGVRMLDQSAFAAKMKQLIQQERYGDVIFQVDENLRKYPTSHELLFWKATAYGHSQSHAKAMEIFRTLTQSYPDSPEGWFGMGVAAQQLGKLDEAVEHFERAYKLQPDDPSHALNLGAYLIHDPDRWKEGLACLQHAERLGHRRARRMINEFEEARKVTGGGR